MSDSGKAARSYTHTSNRAHARTTATIARRDVFKSVLENPFRIQWPEIPQSAQNMFLATLLSSLKGVVKHGARKSANSGDNRALSRSHTTDSIMECSQPSLASTSSLLQDPTSPFDHMTLGINQVTRKLEFQAQSFRKLVTLTTGSRVNQQSCNPASIAVVFVCHADVSPPILSEHIPHLVAGCNSTRPRSDSQGVWEPVKLIVLPEGSEFLLAQALGLRRAAVIAIHGDAPFLPAFSEMLQYVPIISAPWLVSPLQSAARRSLIPTHIKQLRTSVPKDMKAAKDQRAKARAAARARKRVVLTTAEPGL